MLTIFGILFGTSLKVFITKCLDVPSNIYIQNFITLKSNTYVNKYNNIHYSMEFKEDTKCA